MSDELPTPTPETKLAERLSTNILVIGGGVAGVLAALTVAERGQSVLLTDSGSEPGHELTTSAQLWQDSAKLLELQTLLRLPGPCFSLKGAVIPDLLKIALEDALLDAGVALRYGWRPVRRRGHSEVDFAAKAGRCRVQTRAVLDAGDTGIAAWNGEPAQLHQDVMCRRLMHLTGVDLSRVELGELSIPAELGTAWLAPGHSPNGHVLLELRWSTPPSISAALLQARPHSLGVIHWLTGHHPAFADCRVAGMGSVARCSPHREIDREQAAGLWTLPLLALPFPDPLELARQGQDVARQMLEQPWPQSSQDVTWTDAPNQDVEVDVVVVGGGSSGAAAAISAARAGSRVMLAEMHDGLGGSGTLGGVDSYWFGRRAGFNLEVAARVAGEHTWMNWPAGAKWNVEAKALAWQRLAQKADVHVQFGSVLLETHGELGQRITGATFATPDGLLRVRAAVMVDATGDADVAVRAGAGADYGAARDGMTMWASLAQHPRPGLTKNNFTSNVDVGDPQDYTRAIVNGRRRNPGHDHGRYLAPRQTRHLRGAVTLTLTDQLTQKRWPDVVNVAFSNHDVKGHTSSDWLRMGLIPPNLEVEVPYRALLPKTLDGLIVTGKAISAMGDALPAMRMQADLENLGYAAGWAAALCARLSVTPRHLPIRPLQEALVKAGNLPPSVLTRTVEPPITSRVEWQGWIDALDDEIRLPDLSLMEFHEVWRGPIPFVATCTAGPEIVPLLRGQLGPDSPRRVTCARALAWHGDHAATAVLLGEAARLWPGGGLPHRGPVPFTQDSPDHGAMPDLVYLLHTLALLRDRRALPLMTRVAAHLNATPERLRDPTSGLFHYVDALCDFAERLGDPACLPLLHGLQREPLLQGQCSREWRQPDYFAERQAMLELLVNRAAARCGDRRGYAVLTGYLEDARRPLARHARLELTRLAGQDHGPAPRPWRIWLAAQPEPLPCQPWHSQKEMEVTA